MKIDPFDENCGIGVRTRQISRWRKDPIVVLWIGAGIKNRIAGLKSALHFGHFGRADAKIRRNSLCLGMRQPSKAFLRLA